MHELCQGELPTRQDGCEHRIDAAMRGASWIAAGWLANVGLARFLPLVRVQLVCRDPQEIIRAMDFGIEKPQLRSLGLSARWRLWGECMGIYVAIPLVLALLRHQDNALPILPVLWVVAVLAGWWLMTRFGFAIRDFFTLRGIHRSWRPVLIRTSAVAVAAAVIVLAVLPSDFLYLPRQQPVFWLLLIGLYPLASVCPQGIVYRALFRYRYASLWPHPLARRAAATIAFSLAHLVYLNPWALLLTLIGGWFFFRTYESTRSLAAANLEHALCGLAIFTIGFFRYFQEGGAAPVLP